MIRARLLGNLEYFGTSDFTCHDDEQGNPAPSAEGFRGVRGIELYLY